jgi:6-pyruvoyltetrahydropterin/6-carboxytetrahydropterin synthase
VSFSISKSFRFEAAHHLEGLPPGHKCARVHGHSYTVTICLGSTELDATGMVLDYGALGAFKDWLDQTLDHRSLNDYVKQPTAENLAHWIADQIDDLYPWSGMLMWVSVDETANTSAVYYP